MSDAAISTSGAVAQAVAKVEPTKTVEKKVDSTESGEPLKNGAVPSKKEEPKKEPTAAEKRLHKLKIDKEEIEVDDDELKRGYQLARASNKRFEEASAKEKRAMALIELAKSDPLKFLEHPDLGIADLKKLLENKLGEELEFEMLSEEQKTIKKLEKKLAEIEAKEKAEKEKKDKEEYDGLKTKETERIQTKILSALEKSNLPKTPLAVKRMAHYLYQAAQTGTELDAEDVVDLVKADFLEEQKALFAGLDDDALIGYLGEDLAAKVRAHDLKKLKSPNKPFDETPKEPKQPRQTKAKKLSVDEWKDQNRKRLGLA